MYLHIKKDVSVGKFTVTDYIIPVTKNGPYSSAMAFATGSWQSFWIRAKRINSGKNTLFLNKLC